MKKFSLKFVIFLIPFLIFWAIPGYYMILSGEIFYNIDDCVERIVDSKEQFLIGFALDESHYKNLKAQVVNKTGKLEVMALGSSRVLQFRHEMFNGSFYNAGYTVSSINDFKTFLSTLPPEKLPTTLIIGLDQWMFNEAWDNLKNSATEQTYKNTQDENLGSLTRKAINFYRRYLENSMDLNRVHIGPQRAIGLNAYLKSTGFRNDGSMLYGLQIEKLSTGDSSAIDYEFSDTFKRIKKGNMRFEPCEEVNINAVRSLEKLLAYCKKNNIEVVSFLPPFADAVFNNMSKSGHYKHLDLLPSILKDLFKKYKYEFYNYNHLSLCGSSDTEALDGFHGSEKTYQRILIDMLENGSVLNRYCSLLGLKNSFYKSKSNYFIY